MVQYAFDHKEAEERYIEVQVAKNTRIVDVRNIQYIEKGEINVYFIVQMLR